ncbi:hypothetical protein CEUSTIGMA_g2112.t1 [Chlamydomonas eustigma]|uniref:Zinc finger LSD1-type domain-containing protein n=1 Tax=Chlamydomonas eustigma TaxID=1157962 RepID=A0A250WUZ8_9CHLO|nr:hypothetical protein CEUSTIGMA_g2112.t1 [Chlamydomonas eustigma]|eukprot:GAX74664.1 hypothetical protein CEUSTIGMA_g2112.t1 [Chlamydomonas eustigma]
MSYAMPGAGPSTHSHLVCGGCQTLLMYPGGAASVRCQRCHHITNAPPPVTNSSQIVCNGCRVLLSYPRGAESVQCSVCHGVTPVPRYQHVVCGGCNIMLMYPDNASCVKCSVCHFVTPVNSSPGPAGQSGASSSASRPNQTVVIENPPSLDEHGHEVTNIAVGVKSDNQ